MDRSSDDATATPDRADIRDSTLPDRDPADVEDAAVDRAEAMTDATQPEDRAPLDTAGHETHVPENCMLAEGITAQWVYPSGRTGSLCAPLRGMAIGFDTINCRPRLTAAGAAVLSTRMTFEAMGQLFSRAGAAFGAFVLDDLGTDCATPDLDSMMCRYRRQDYMCQMNVTRAGGPGDIVETVLAAPCRLLHDYGGPVTEVTLTSARIRGRLRYGGDIAFAGHDGGAPDCGIGP